MRVALSATGVDTDIALFRVEVNEDGGWTYQSRAIAHAAGRLSEADRVQFKSLYDKVDWGLEVLNMPVSADDRTLFRMEVDHGHGDTRLYQFSEAINHASWQFRDLVHFLRHNVAVAGEPVGPEPAGNDVQPQPWS